jgi:hypothetical protein
MELGSGVDTTLFVGSREKNKNRYFVIFIITGTGI